jgi:hypothetical protein
MPTAPTAAELLQNPLVKQSLDQAWQESQPNDPVQRHEEGGWIYMDMTSGAITVQRARPGLADMIFLDPPPVVLCSVIVGIFHTHPNPTSEGWYPGPSPLDEEFDEAHGVPDLIVTDQGVLVNGPDVRRGGLSGPAGFPR